MRLQLQTHWLRLVCLFGLVAALLPAFSQQPAAAAGVVGDGDPASCTEAAFDDALAGGGLVTFNCGPAVTVIPLTTTKFIVTDTEIDGADVIVLDMNDNNRHFFVPAGSTLRLSDIRLEDGLAVDDGGAISSNGMVIADNVEFSGNEAPQHGGAIYNAGTLTVRGGTMNINVSHADGGTIYNAPTGSVELTAEAEIIGSLADNPGRGGGIFNDGGVVDINGSTSFSLTRALDGGALFNTNGGTVTVSDAIFNGTVAAADGGTIYNDATGGLITIERSSILLTEANATGGAIWNAADMLISTTSIAGSEAMAGAGGAIFNSAGGTLTITRSTFAGNTAATHGGALANEGEATLETSTLFNNSALSMGGGIVNQALLTVLNSTITDNTSGAAGGGINNGPAGTLMLSNTIIAENPTGDCSNIGLVISNGHNLDSDGSCPLGMANDISNGNANLGTPFLNGGPTSNLMPQPGSDAIDAGPASCTSPDQRGEVRPQNGACDIGAVEIMPPADVCFNLWTGFLQTPSGGECNGVHLHKVVFEDNGPHYLCANPYTGILSYSFGPTCQPGNAPAIVMPDAAPLDVCLSVYTGRYRINPLAQPCSNGEFATMLQ